MNTFRKMIMIPVEEYNKYRNLMYTTQVVPAVNPMQKEMTDIQAKYGDNLPDDQRNKLEAEIIQKYTGKPIDPSPAPEIDKSQLEWIKSSLADFGKTNKTRANQLYNQLDSRLSNRWNENGEILTVNGEPIQGSNILDLIDYVTSAQKSKRVPMGIRDFKEMLTQANVPSYIYSKRGLDDINKQMDDDIEGVDVLFKQELPTSSSKKKKKKKRDWITA